ncbi:hypothetical protein BS78_07G003900 [Paspalum vaginatum]|nr:hypothetical protein BS78_07G003900 [Paspalum vaginatum]
MEEQQQPSSSGATPSSSSQRRAELQGPRPAPLQVRKDSRKIRKPPLPHAQQQVRQPVIIYTVSPKVVHAEPSEFMSVVQRLTGARRGPTTASASSSSALPAQAAPLQHQITSSPLPFPFFGGQGQHHHSEQVHPQMSHFPFPLLHQQEAARAPPDDLLGLQLSPAARLAAIERGSSSVRSSGDVGGGLPQPSPSSILSPGSFPAIPPSFFSPAPVGHAVAGGGLLGGLISPAAFLSGAATAGAGGSITTATAGASQNIVTLPEPEEASPSAPSPSGAYYWDLFNNRHC